jgi:hypothetical protein
MPIAVAIPLSRLFASRTMIVAAHAHHAIGGGHHHDAMTLPGGHGANARAHHRGTDGNIGLRMPLAIAATL